MNGIASEGIGAGCPLLDEDEKVCDAILRMSTASNGKLADRAWEKKQERTGEHLTDIGRGHADDSMSFKQITAQPQEAYPTPIGTSAKHGGARYTPFSLMTERNVPTFTLTGRQHYYLDHEIFREFGENMATYKPSLPPVVMAPEDVDVPRSEERRVGKEC